MLLVAPVLLFAFLWRIDRNIAGSDPNDGPVDPSETDLVAIQVAAAERLRREAAAATDPDARERLTRLAREAEADAEKLLKDSPR